MDPTPTTAFIARWSAASGSERANYQLFVTELCELLGTPKPDPASNDTRDNAYVFERRVQFAHGDGTQSPGFIDCYQRGRFVLEAKKVRAGAHTKGFDDALLRARAQAESYARALPASEGRPPFLVVVDVGHVIELYAEFSRSGATYTPFPDPRSHRIRLTDLHDERVIERLRTLWLDPLALDPARTSAKVTRAVSAELALLATSLEAPGPHGQHAPQAVAAFLTRCLFSMFAEDVALLPERSFKELLLRHREDPATLRKMLRVLWADMDRGGFSAALAQDVLRFNGKLFKGAAADGYVLALNRDQIDGLLRAANADWREVEPAIFGTLLERALAPDERHALGAHYTPRAYVERLVLPTVVQPLRADWADVQAAALLLANEGQLAEARAEVRRFHHQLCSTRVLDPACGSGNFLYVTLEHLKRLEGEVINLLQAYGQGTDEARQDKLGFAGETVTLQQLLGIEINPRAAALAELVLWIGFLQWHIRTLGNASVAEPVIHDYGNIDCRDAVLACDRMDYVLDAQGHAVTRWDGVHFKPHPVTGEQVPDEAFQTAQERYVNPRKADWPAVDFIVGNPPFIGASTLRRALGDGYAQALRAAWKDVPESADFVMHWWHAAAQKVAGGQARRFGFITTNSLPQAFNRRVVQAALAGDKPIHLAYAIADHPWVDSVDGAAVRISMTVGAPGAGEGELLAVTRETPLDDGSAEVSLTMQCGVVHADLRVGANVAAARSLLANDELSNRGFCLFGAGFVLTGAEAAALGLGSTPGLETHIREYRNGRDLMDRPRNALVIDLFGLAVADVRLRFPAVYQWVLERVKPERDNNNRKSRRENWWIFGEPNSKLRRQLIGLPRYIATVETARHRSFQFLDASIAPDNKLIAIALPDAAPLGVLSSRAHVLWAIATGSKLGVGNDPVYVKTKCFEAFPFPNLAEQPELAAQIAAAAEELDALRKRQQAAHATLTLTDMYNVLDALRLRRTLTAKEKLVHADGLVSVIAELHDRLDALVLRAYGWADLAPALVGQPGGTLPWPARPAAQAAAEEELLARLVALNAERALEESRGTVRWLRPDFQDPARRGAATLPAATQGEMDLGLDDDTAPAPAVAKKGGKIAAAATAAAQKQPWPNTLPEQMRAVAALLNAAGRPVALSAIEAGFSGRGLWKRRLPQILDALAALGRARVVNGAWTLG
ncbi:MAG: class I SAM-dependent DNA methyltransferase [Bacteriovorax sp.]|nr:class I SAM-dependent DNA methyltransferase [Rhizobacter sp.]